MDIILIPPRLRFCRSSQSPQPRTRRFQSTTLLLKSNHTPRLMHRGCTHTRQGYSPNLPRLHSNISLCRSHSINPHSRLPRHTGRLHHNSCKPILCSTHKISHPSRMDAPPPNPARHDPRRLPLPTYLRTLGRTPHKMDKIHTQRIHASIKQPFPIQ